MSRLRSIIVICVIVIVIGHSDSQRYTRNGRELRKNRVPEEQVYRDDRQKSLKRRRPRQVRTSNELFQEISTSDLEAASRRPVITERTGEDEALRRQQYEESWILAGELLQTLWEEDERDRLKRLKIDNPIVETRNRSRECQTVVASIDCQTAAERKKEKILEDLRRKWRERKERRTEPLEMAGLKDPAVLQLEAERIWDREYRKDRRERLKETKQKERAALAEQRKMMKKNDARHKEQLKEARRKHKADLKAERKRERECIKLEKKRKRKSERNKRWYQRLREAMSKDPKALEAYQKRRRESHERFRERRKQARLANSAAALETCSKRS